MVARSLAFVVFGCLASCEKLSSVEEKLVGSWEARVASDSSTIFTFEPNHTDWAVVHFHEDTWLDGTGRWHVQGSEIVYDDVKYPEVAAEVAANDPSLANRPHHYTATFDLIGADTLKLDGITLKRTKRPSKPSNPAPFSP
ncbi:MAG: hypothetical protein H0X40_19885 [Chthoniobacterales bacterium]|nr:hypothetical protein [Chthoniobacterales bacterium]